MPDANDFSVSFLISVEMIDFKNRASVQVCSKMFKNKLLYNARRDGPTSVRL